ncbi:MAG: sensor histidine kinase [Bacilli bacterium]
MRLQRQFRNKLTFTWKLWIIIFFIASILVLSIVWFTNYSYRNLYVKELKQSLSLEVDRYRDVYNQSEMNVFKRTIDISNGLNDEQVMFIYNEDSTKTLQSLLRQYTIDLTTREQKQLENGHTITREGYEATLNASILGAISPLENEKGQSGILYIYVPIATLNEFWGHEKYTYILFVCLISLLFIVLGMWLIQQITSPLQQIREATLRLKNGDYSARLHFAGADEIAQLGESFDAMAQTIETEEDLKREFLQNVSHELRTPLSNIKGYSHLLEQTINGETEEHYLTIVQREVSRMERLVNDLLDLAREEGQALPMQLTPIVLAQVIYDVLATYPEQDKHVFQSQLDESLIILGDVDRLQQVLHNLVNNAIKYATPHTPIEVRLYEHAGQGLLEVKNYGVPISPEVVARVGERFLRSETGRTRQTGGFGLGLAIVKQIMRQHGGKLQLFSQTDGTNVKLTLPLCE